jgi:hypothetical protein
LIPPVPQTQISSRKDYNSSTDSAISSRVIAASARSRTTASSANFDPRGENLFKISDSRSHAPEPSYAFASFPRSEDTTDNWSTTARTWAPASKRVSLSPVQDRNQYNPLPSSSSSSGHRAVLATEFKKPGHYSNPKREGVKPLQEIGNFFNSLLGNEAR